MFFVFISKCCYRFSCHTWKLLFKHIIYIFWYSVLL